MDEASESKQIISHGANSAETALGFEPYYRKLTDKTSGFAEIKNALQHILENVGNEEDCFWLSHAWAESLIQGKTVSKENFPSGGVDIRIDPSWKKDEPDYIGRHVSWGAEPYMITEWTKGKKKDLSPREYHHLQYFEGNEELFKHIQALDNGSLAMVSFFPANKGESGHALLMAKINGYIVIIDSSMEPGPWVKSWEQFADEEWQGPKGFDVYDYPEKIYFFKNAQRVQLEGEAS